MTTQMTIKEALQNVGGLSNPSKMPSFGYSLPATICNVGSKLRTVPNSICSSCYALKGRYMFNNVQSALWRRLESMKNKSLWIESMSFLMNKKQLKFFRWHDSGDLQDLPHFKAIIQVCVNTPTTKHWLPTRETKLVTEAIKNGLVIPENLTIRLSAMAFDKPAPENTAKKFGLQVSGASKINSGNCLAPSQGGECKDCRKCWDKNEFSVIYKAH